MFYILQSTKTTSLLYIDKLKFWCMTIITKSLLGLIYSMLTLYMDSTVSKGIQDQLHTFVQNFVESAAKIQSSIYVFKKKFTVFLQPVHCISMLHYVGMFVQLLGKLNHKTPNLVAHRTVSSMHVCMGTCLHE